MASVDQTVLQFFPSSTSMSAKVDPLVIFNICDCFVRRPDQAERVIRTLLGSVLRDGPSIFVIRMSFRTTNRLTRIPFVCGGRNLGEALRQIREGPVMIRTKHEAETGIIRFALASHSTDSYCYSNTRESNNQTIANALLIKRLQELKMDIERLQL
ncbi:hypothetical protein L1987_43027 [Smallanthus sonchifolius]|uniref:Uncharacterized protein n=1 Tax=Smallanthus sonchifolius TaxID=185202 RepID=A0ACB9GL62_9ASTR|nr:hypothetical protein L1987_43027 [Smallanthus sonchifolius]